MTTTIPAIFENGVLRPLAPLTLTEGQEVQVAIGVDEKVNGGRPPRSSGLANDSIEAVENLSEEEFEACLDHLADGLDLPIFPSSAYSRESIYGGD